MAGRMTDSRRCAQEMTQFVGTKIVGVHYDPNGDAFGFEVQRSASARWILWVQQDAEGNGGGFVQAQPLSPAPADRELTARDLLRAGWLRSRQGTWQHPQGARDVWHDLPTALKIERGIRGEGR